MAQGPALLLGWDPDFLATAKPHGSVVVCAMAGPLPTNNKEPVGQAFQTAVMRQQGLIGEFTVSTGSPLCERSTAFGAPGLARPSLCSVAEIHETKWLPALVT